MTFIFGSAEQIAQSIYPILAISTLLTLLVCLLVYKVFDISKWIMVALAVLLLTATATFSTFNLSTMFYQLSLQGQQVTITLAVPDVYRQSFQAHQLKYVDAVTPNPKYDLCHVVLEDSQGMLYQSLDTDVKRCEDIQKTLVQALQLKARPPKPKSSHSPPPLPSHVK